MDRNELGTKKDSPFRVFEFHSGAFEDDICKVIHDCLVKIHIEIPDDKIAKEMAYPIVVSALTSVGVWPQYFNRETVLEIGSIDWREIIESKLELKKFWKIEDRLKKIMPFLPEIKQNKWAPVAYEQWWMETATKKVRDRDNINIQPPQDGPEEVWGAAIHPFAGRRCILSYVHDKACDKGGSDESEIATGDDGRRAVRLTKDEVSQVSRPHFVYSERQENFSNIWHDGMKYPSPDGAWNSYSGVVPYMLPGSCVWHLVPRIRRSSVHDGYPSTGTSEVYDNIIFSYAQTRKQKEIRGLDGVTIKPASDSPVRDLSGVLRLWMMAEATCGMLRNDVIISIEDMAGLALTFMHYDNILAEMKKIIAMAKSDDKTKVKRKRNLLCIKPSATYLNWADLCECNEGSKAVIRKTMEDAGYENNLENFEDAYFCFLDTVYHLKFWYALLLANGDIGDQRKIRYEILEDLAKAPAWDKKDRAKVYFMIEAAIINRTERNIPYEESIQRFLRSGDIGGKLLFESINLRAEPIKMEMTLFQRRQLAFFFERARIRQPGTFSKDFDKVMAYAWMSGTPGLSYVGRFTTSYSKPLYIEAAQAWANMSTKDIVEMSTLSKKRMVVLLTEDHRMFRKVDLPTKTVITMCTIFFLDEDQHNLVLSSFGEECFHAEERQFRGQAERMDTHGNAVDFQNKRNAICAVNCKGKSFEIDHPESNMPEHFSHTACYQIVVTHNIDDNDCCNLVAIRQIKFRNEQEKKSNRPNKVTNYRIPAAVSYSDILRHVNGPDQDKLFTMRPDRMSPDGVSIVDYSFEYEIFWVDKQGKSRSNTNAGNERVSEVVRSTVKMLREKHWDSANVSAQSIIGSDTD